MDRARDLRFVRHVCEAFTTMAKGGGNSSAKSDAVPFRMPRDDPLFKEIGQALLETLDASLKHEATGEGGNSNSQGQAKRPVRATDQWTPCMESAMTAVFQLSDHPESTVGELMHSLVVKVDQELAAIQAQLDEKKRAAEEEGRPEDPHPLTDEQLARRDLLLCRVLAAIGHVAMRMLLHLEGPYVGL